MSETATPDHIEKEEAERIPVEAAFAALHATAEGLSPQEAARRLASAGPNSLTEHGKSMWLTLAGYFWGPIPWMIEVAAILSAVVRHWPDFIIILALLVFNAGIGFWQEYKASNALDALKQQLALHARVRRGGVWGQIAAAELVPGDVIRLRAGDVIPADAKLFEGDFLAIDQSALTGESMPVDRRAGGMAWSGAIARQGEMLALVTATGERTFFGKTAKLVETAGAPSHFQKAVLAIGDYLIGLSLVLVAVLLCVELYRGTNFLEVVQFALILTVASIPVAMPAVLSVTMAAGALKLSHQKAIVARLQSIEEMAGIDILCSDKTGTLTQNRLTLGAPVLFAGADPQEVIRAGALASKAENGDPIDGAVIAGLADPQALTGWKVTDFRPFDPVGKRTEARVTAPDGTVITVTKGAPQVILTLAPLPDAEAARAAEAVAGFAARGDRALAVAQRHEDEPWRMLGLLPMSDPPRPDSARTIAEARAHGIAVKLVTGDNTAIAREIAGTLGLGRDIQPARDLFDPEGRTAADGSARIAAAAGFAEVFPAHKFAIVKSLQAGGHLVGMTGDGVNDAPALKQADVGIAVSGATDAARAAADLILTAPGLSTIIGAVEEARRIFERMNSYAIYRINETIRIMIFVVLAMILYGFYPITAIMIILLAFFNDIPIMAIAYDNTWLSPGPVRWDMHRVLSVSTAMGLTGTVGSFLMLWLAMDWLKLPLDKIQTYIFLKMAVSGHLALFSARSRSWYVRRPWPAPVMIWAAVGTKVLATMLCLWPLGLMAPLNWADVGIVWAYSILWAFVTDAAKIAVYRAFSRDHSRHAGFLRLVGRRIASAR